MVMQTSNTPWSANLLIGKSAPGQMDIISEIYQLDPSFEEQFLAFHNANPHIYRRLRAMALRLKRAGHTRWGIKNLWEKLRYDDAIRVDPGAPGGIATFALNNNFTAYYARLLMQREPTLAGFFEIRERQVKK